MKKFIFIFISVLLFLFSFKVVYAITVTPNHWLTSYSGSPGFVLEKGGQYNLIFNVEQFNRGDSYSSLNYYMAPGAVVFNKMGTSRSILEGGFSFLSSYVGDLAIDSCVITNGVGNYPCQVSITVPTTLEDNTIYEMALFAKAFAVQDPGGIQSPGTVDVQYSPVLVMPFMVSPSTTIVSGELRDENTNIITGIEGRVFMVSEGGKYRQASIDPLTGTYKFEDVEGCITWYLDFDLEPASNYSWRGHPDYPVQILQCQSGGGQQASVVNLKAIAESSSISGVVKDELGNEVSGVLVAIGKSSFDPGASITDFQDIIFDSDKTDANGNYALKIPPGTYFVKTFLSSSSQYINADEQKIILVSDDSKKVDLQLKGRTRTISGQVFLTGKAAGGANVWAWSDKGGFRETKSNATGFYALDITASDSWHIAASYLENNIFYKTDEITLPAGVLNYDLYLYSAGTVFVPVAKSVNSSSELVLTAANGAKLIAPANSLASSGTVSGGIGANIDLPSQGEVRPVGIGYDFNINGGAITNFASDVVVSLPYDLTETARLGVDEDELVIVSWDEENSTWAPAELSVVNKADKVVSALLAHFTRFVIVAPADIVPPAAPTNISVALTSEGLVKLSWANPPSDFHHIKIYRSNALGEIGSVVFNDIVGVSQIDSDVIGGETYYYTVRAVDPAGNESANNDQVSIFVDTAPSPQPSCDKFSLNDAVRTTANLSVRATPSVSGALIGVQAMGAKGTISAGGIFADDYCWWQIKYNDGMEGWSADDWLELYLIPSIDYKER